MPKPVCVDRKRICLLLYNIKTLISRGGLAFSNTSSETYPMPFSPRICYFQPCCVVSNLICMSKRSGPETGRRRAGDGPEMGRRRAGDGPEIGRRWSHSGYRTRRRAVPNRIHPDKEARSSGVGSHRARSKIKCG
jgi:hypothetical protein